MSTDSVNTPILKDLTVENITENVKTINSQGDDSRMKYLFERLVQHLHDYARETRLSTGEWEAAIRFLTKTGQICTDVRQVSTLYIRPYVKSVLLDPGLRSLGIYPSVRRPRLVSLSGRH